MKPFIRWRSFVRYAATLLSLAAGVLISPTVASAGCTSHVTANTNPLDIASMTGLEIFKGSGKDVAHPDEALPGRRLPCSGPSCSEAPKPPVVPASTESVRTDQWGCLTAAHEFDAVGYFTLRDEGRVRPVHAGSSLDRPPRHPSLLAS
ncbi:hypothetical protein [Singulisphaera sp. PoT]|uniref:hypothetical protein n=1 Tax=Singulisphaera sp. PoT TaxID=3411797 RepID=UPI003BF4D9D3